MVCARSMLAFVVFECFLCCSCRSGFGPSGRGEVGEAHHDDAVGAEAGEGASTERSTAEGDLTPRARAVRAELARYGTRDFTFDASGLSAQDSALLRELLRTAQLIEELDMLQRHRQNLEWLARVQQSGSDDDRELYRRYQRPWCLSDRSALCVALEGVPERRIWEYQWPAGMTDEEFAQIRQAENSDELMSPFTVVQRAGESRWRGVPYTQTELHGPRIRHIAESLNAAARHADTESLGRYLSSAASYIATDDFELHPFRAQVSREHWINIDSRWEVLVDFGADFQGPRQHTARFGMYIGIVDREATEAIEAFRMNRQDLEANLAALVGDDIYQTQNVDLAWTIRVARLVMAAGESRLPTGATAGLNGETSTARIDWECMRAELYSREAGCEDNRPASVREVQLKTVIFNNVVGNTRSSHLILDQDQAALIGDRDEMAGLVTFHEFAHSIGADGTLGIVIDGQQTTVDDALGHLSSPLEELKADIMGLWLMEQRHQAGVISDAQANRWYLTYVMHILGHAGAPPSPTYFRSGAIQLGHFMENGAVAYDERTGNIRTNLAEMPAAAAALARQVMRIRLSGDRSGAEALHDRYVLGNASEGYALAPRLAGPVAAMLEQIEEAGGRTNHTRYQITGL